MNEELTVRRLVVGELSANCYIVGTKTSKAGLLIDPGGNSGEISRAIVDSGLDIEVIVLTHGHSDHIAALRDIQDKTGAEVAIHIADAQALQGRGPYSSMFGISYRTPAPPDRLLKKGDSIDIGDMHFTVMHTPGHTAGSICLYGHNRVFSGDTLFRRGIGTTYTFGSSRRQLVDSIKDSLMALPESTIVYPGHGRETTIGNEFQGNRFLKDR